MNNNIELQPQTQKYSDNLNSLSNTFFSVLDDYKKYYVFTNKNPDVNEYQNYFLNSKTQLEKANKDVIDITNNIKYDITQLGTIINRINLQLANEKELNAELKKLIDNLNNNNNGSNIMLDETTDIYNKQYLWNIEIFTGILILCVLIAKTYKNA